MTASSNHTFSTKVACLTNPSKVVAEGTIERRACSSVSPSRQQLSARRGAVEEHFELHLQWLADRVFGASHRRVGHCYSIAAFRKATAFGRPDTP